MVFSLFSPKMVATCSSDILVPSYPNIQHHIQLASSNYQIIFMILSNGYANADCSFICHFASAVIFGRSDHLNMLRVEIKPCYCGYTKPQTFC
jgi:hypothetical protein